MTSGLSVCHINTMFAIVNDAITSWKSKLSIISVFQTFILSWVTCKCVFVKKTIFSTYFLSLFSKYTSIVFIFKANRHELQATKLTFDFMVSLN